MKQLSRTNVNYWKSKLIKNPNLTGTSGGHSSTYSARMVFKNRRVRFPLHIANKDEAAAKATKIFIFLVENGWEETLSKFKPKNIEEVKSQPSTIGDLIAIARKYSTARERTYSTYAIALRNIVSQIMLRESPKTFSSRSKLGNDLWRAQVDQLEIAELSPTRIQAWKTNYLKDKSKDPEELKHAIVSLNSLIRNARSLFAKKILPFLREELELPSPLPFENISLEKQPSQRYRSKIDAQLILRNAKGELAAQEPESYKILLLALICGLRISEIDYLEWSVFDFNEETLEIKDSKYHQLKSEDSAGFIKLNAEVCSIFEEFHKNSDDNFVISTQRKTRILVDRKSRGYRCKTAHLILLKWLRNQGITALKPVHELRKEIGSLIASEQGIFAASTYLRHSDVRITSQIYADMKKPVTAPLNIDL